MYSDAYQSQKKEGNYSEMDSMKVEASQKIRNTLSKDVQSPLAEEKIDDDEPVSKPTEAQKSIIQQRNSRRQQKGSIKEEPRLSQRELITDKEEIMNS